MLTLFVLPCLQAGPAGVFSHTEVFSCIYNTLRHVFRCEWCHRFHSEPWCGRIYLLVKLMTAFFCRCCALLCSHSLVCRHMGLGDGKKRRHLHLLNALHACSLPTLFRELSYLELTSAGIWFPVHSRRREARLTDSAADRRREQIRRWKNLCLGFYLEQSCQEIVRPSAVCACCSGTATLRGLSLQAGEGDAVVHGRHGQVHLWPWKLHQHRIYVSPPPTEGGGVGRPKRRLREEIAEIVVIWIGYNKMLALVRTSFWLV